MLVVAVNTYVFTQFTLSTKIPCACLMDWLDTILFKTLFQRLPFGGAWTPRSTAQFLHGITFNAGLKKSIKCIDKKKVSKSNARKHRCNFVSRIAIAILYGLTKVVLVATSHEMSMIAILVV